MSEPIDAQQTPTVWDVAIVGAGIIGLACAWALQRRGLRVLLLDREGIAEMTSRGNAGAIAVSDILPLASPGIIRKAPKWLLDPLGPLAIPLPYFPRILRWLWHFPGSCRGCGISGARPHRRGSRRGSPRWPP
jgi:glycine/D-amino acid oxidase-like deaminating enzyme